MKDCACVHDDPCECARIRDRISCPNLDEDDDSHKRACECACHERDDEDEENQWPSGRM